jgi:hypothetical protein
MSFPEVIRIPFVAVSEVAVVENVVGMRFRQVLSKETMSAGRTFGNRKPLNQECSPPLALADWTGQQLLGAINFKHGLFRDGSWFFVEPRGKFTLR